MNKDNKNKAKFRVNTINHSFTGNKLTQYSGLSVVSKYIKKAGIGKELNDLFSTSLYNSTKFTNVQVLLSAVYASLCGVNRVSRICDFTNDCLVQALLSLKKGLNKDVIKARLVSMGERGSRMLEEYCLKKAFGFVGQYGLKSITLDVDSTVFIAYGNQQGAEKGFNPKKQGAKSYHPLLAFCSELKLVLNSWFRPGNTYTSNGIVEFVKQLHAHLPETIEKVFFRADSGFFNGLLFDFLEFVNWDYLVKVKLKGLTALLKNQDWEKINENQASCVFSYKADKWSKSRTFYAIRTVKEWKEVEIFGKKELIPVYQYACYCSNLKKTVLEIHELYCQRATSENWIEHVKNQLMAGKTLTDDFYANDMLWQLSVLAYNISQMMRTKIKKFAKQEHNTFKDWFINVAGKLVSSANQLHLKIYQHYLYKDDWIKMENAL